MKSKVALRKNLNKLFAIVLTGTMFINTISTQVFAVTSKTEVTGKYFEFDEDSHYEFTDAKYVSTDEVETYGSFAISGNISDVNTKNGVPAYKIEEGNVSIYYNHSDSLLNNDDKDTWHLTEDKSKKIDGITLDSNIQKGAIIVQTSTDKINWSDVVNLTDAFNETPTRTNSIYESKDVQLINGCYYRVIIAYELKQRVEESNILFVNTDKYEYKKCLEFYEFYAYNNIDSDTTNNDQTYNLGSKVKVDDFDSYFGEQIIDKDDPHYGWDLGNFFVSGYTDKVTSSDNNIVFLKNVGDKVTLWFRLNQDINKLNGNDKLSITADKKGSDQYFETSTMDFGRGTLIIRYTDHNNVKKEPTIYTNYLEANTSFGADTKVQLFEEGDYEVALDYEITSDQLIDKIYHYRIFFKFSIRNGNCMVYPFDLETGNELTNSALTENGFRLDLAKSRYLKVNIKRETLTDTADGLIEDTRFNGPAKDGAEYTDEGIYIISVNNVYTNQLTIKKIYVGTNSVLKAYMTTGLSIPEINNLVSQGATISNDGTIKLSNNVEIKPNTTPNENSEDVIGETNKTDNPDNILIPIIIGVVIICCSSIALMLAQKNKSSKTKDNEVKNIISTEKNTQNGNTQDNQNSIGGQSNETNDKTSS